MSKTWGKSFPATIFFVGIIALGIAYYVEFFYGLQPCNLCLYQRVPYGVAMALALAMLYKPKMAALIVMTTSVVFFFNAILALYHVGVEQHLWVSVSGCQSQLIEEVNVNVLKELLQQEGQKTCDSVEWSVFGISMAGYNTIISSILSAVCFYEFLKVRRAKIG